MLIPVGGVRVSSTGNPNAGGLVLNGTATSLCGNREYKSRPSRAHTGWKFPTLASFGAGIRWPVGGNGSTNTLAVSHPSPPAAKGGAPSDEYATHRPSGEKVAPCIKS